jgi:ADP-heptose:LPS heptosyltransferase
LIGGADDYRLCGEIVRGGLGLNLAGQTSLAESAAIIARSSLLLSGDSGMLHVAVGLGKSTVSLFGAGIAAKWAPKGPCHIVVDHRLSCSPCTRFGYTPRCVKGVQCLQLIGVTEVLMAVNTLLARAGEGKRAC